MNKSRGPLNAPLIIAFALLCAIAVPVFAGAAVDSKNQDVTITVNKGLEMVTPGGAQAITAVTPTGTGDTTSTAASGSVSLRSNATWAATIASSNATVVMGENDARTSGTLATAPSVSGDGTTYSVLTANASPATIKTAQARNTTNTALSYSYFIRQPISWADESGDYKIAITHGANN